LREELLESLAGDVGNDLVTLGSVIIGNGPAKPDLGPTVIALPGAYTGFVNVVGTGRGGEF